ncbi:MAG: hypothetical protein [Inoviridae sp.]|nr:MAG: hypothetical protein [Inoviridae sp.]
MWDENEQEYFYERIPDKADVWLNPFTGKQEKAPTMFDEKEYERKKQRSLASSMGRTVNAIYRLARANTWDWFITLTFNPDKVDSFDYSATVKKLSLWLNNAKKICPDMGYMIVPEKHPTSGRYHFHGLFKNCDGLGFVQSGHKDKKGRIVYNVGKYKLGWTTATEVTDNSRATKYIGKYINKDLCQVAFGKKRYWASRNLDEPEVTEVILDKDKMQMLVSRLSETASYIKRIENGEVTTTYYELPEGVCDEEW